MNNNTQQRRPRLESTQTEGDKFYIPNWSAIREETVKVYATEYADEGIEWKPPTSADVHVWGVTEVDDRQMFFHSKAAWKALSYAKYSITFLAQLHGEKLPVFVQLEKDRAFVAHEMTKQTEQE